MKLISIGILFIIGSIFFLKDSYDELYVARNGLLVEMIIKRLPSSCLGTRANHYADMQYHDIVFTKKIGALFCEEHAIGEKIQMKYLEGNDVVLFPDENPIKEIFSSILLGVFGIGFIIYGVLKK